MPGADMASTEVTVSRGTNDPDWVWTFAGTDLSGSSIVMTATWPGGSVVQSSALGQLIIDGEALTWDRSSTVASGIPLGRLTTYRTLRTIAGETSEIDAGYITVTSGPSMNTATGAGVEVPGIQGPPAWVHRGPWMPDTTYPAKSSVSHGGSTWLTLAATDDEPGVGADWTVIAERGSDGPISFTSISDDGYQTEVDGRFLADLSAAPLTWLMPADPAPGAVVVVQVDGNAATDPLTLNGNGESFLGGATLTVDIPNARLDLIFLDGLWRY